MSDPSAAELCWDAVVSYHRAIDTGHATTALEYFTEDAEFEVNDDCYRGRDEIGRFLQKRQAQTDPQTAHLIVNRQADSTSDHALTLRAIIVVLFLEGDESYTARRILATTHQFRLTFEGWRITARRSKPLHGDVNRT